MKNAVIYTHPKSKATKTYLSTSQRILGKDIKIEPPIKLGVLSRFLRSIGLG